MACSAIPPETIDAYRKADYRFGAGAEAATLRIDQRCDELARLYAAAGLACAVFVTAWNPFGRLQSVEANDAAHRSLGSELRTLSAVVIEGEGIDPSGAWPAEKSFCALGVSLDAARDIGRRYRQNAVVWAGPDAVARLILLR